MLPSSIYPSLFVRLFICRLVWCSHKKRRKKDRNEIEFHSILFLSRRLRQLVLIEYRLLCKNRKRLAEGFKKEMDLYRLRPDASVYLRRVLCVVRVEVGYFFIPTSLKLEGSKWNKQHKTRRTNPRNRRTIPGVGRLIADVRRGTNTAAGRSIRPC